MPRIFCDIDDTIIRDGEVYQPVVDFLEEEAEEVVFLTNRPESERERTVADLERTGVEYERLIMNPGEEPAPEFKARVIKEEYLDKGLRADGLIDNREDTRNAVERLGVRALSPEEVAAYMEAEEEEDDAEEPEAVARPSAAPAKAVPVPAFISANAERGLRYHEEGRGGEGLKEQTIREARDMVNGSVTEDKVRRMGPWLRRHEGDLDAPKNRDKDDPEYPGAGLVAWLLWGGDADGNMRAADWAERTVARLDEEAKVAASRKVMTPEEIVDTLKAEAVALVSERDDLRATVEKLTVGAAAEAEALKVEAAAKDARINELSAALEAADKLVSDLSQKVAALEGSAITASAEAAKIAASVGVEPVEQTPADKPTVKTADDIRAEFLAMPFGKERTAFFNKHRKDILGR